MPRSASRRQAAILAALLLLEPIEKASSAGASSLDDPLPRRTYVGAQTAPVSDERRAALRLPPGEGIEVRSVVPGSPAEKAGLRAEDVLLEADGAPLASPTDLMARISHRPSGSEIALLILRDGTKEKKLVRLQEVPLESSPGYRVVYGSVKIASGRLRTILTKPKAGGPHPALFIIQGIGAFTMERTPGSFDFYGPILDEFAAQGFVTLRVDKPGCGDSQGGPLQDADFETQLDGFRQALSALAADPDVDAARILIFGHSMGGVWGPLLGKERPVRGIAVYGTLSRTWIEYSLENVRRQGALAGSTPSELDSLVRREAAASHYLYVERMSPAKMLAAHPDLRGWAEESLDQGKYYSGLHYRFLQQLSALNLAAAWEAYPGRVLAVWGKSDFLSGEEDHRLIAQIAESHGKGRGEFVALGGSDHGFFEAVSIESSFATWGRSDRKRNPAIVALLRDWARRVLAG